MNDMRKTVMIELVLSAVLLMTGLFGCRTARPSAGDDQSTDMMYSDSASDAKILVYVLDQKAYTLYYGYVINYYGEPLREGGFYEIIADVTYLNGGVAGYVNYPKISSIKSYEEVSPLNLGLPSIRENIYGLSLIGDYADADVFLNEYRKMAVWKDGSWIYRYDRSKKEEDGTVICYRNDVSEEEINAGREEGILLCENYFVLPQTD